MQKILVLMVCAISAMAQTATVNVGGNTLQINPLPRSTVTFVLGSGQADAQGNIVLSLTQTTTRRQPAAIQFDLSFVAADFTIAPSVVAGPTAQAAMKTVACNSVSSSTTRCLISGLNQTTIANGVVANVSARINKNTAITVTNVVASSVEGTMLTTAVSAGGAITAALTVTQATCTPPVWDVNLPVSTFNIEPTEVLQCVATLSAPAPVGGLAVTATSTLPSVIISPVAFAAGAVTTNFTLTGM